MRIDLDSKVADSAEFDYLRDAEKESLVYLSKTFPLIPSNYFQTRGAMHVLENNT